MYLHDTLKNIKSKDDFIAFIKELEKDYIDNQHEWDNTDIDQYLNAIWGWAEDCSAPSDSKIDWEHPDWATFALLLYMGKIYE